MTTADLSFVTTLRYRQIAMPGKDPTEKGDSHVVTTAPGNVHAHAATSSAIEPDFWKRFKDHKVVQWTLAYAAAAYTLLHVVEMIGEALDWRHVVARAVTVSLILGVPVVATLAWYHGHRALYASVDRSLRS